MKGGDTAQDMLNEMHPDAGEKTHKICVMGFALGAACGGSKMEKGFEVDPF